LSRVARRPNLECHCHSPLRNWGREEGTEINDTSTDTNFTGADVMAWLDTEEADVQARRLAARRGLGGYDAVAENVLADARAAVWSRMQSDTPLIVEKPGAYGTAVIRSVLRQLAQGREGPVEVVGSGGEVEIVAATAHPPASWPPLPDAPAADSSGDDLRVLLEELDDGRPWVTSAALTYLTLLQHPEASFPDAPWPRAGATPEQARCWPGLWFAGERELFADRGDSRDEARVRRTRARRIKVVLERLRRAMAAHRSERERRRG
jgi:hypothetical protein